MATSRHSSVVLGEPHTVGGDDAPFYALESTSHAWIKDWEVHGQIKKGEVVSSHILSTGAVEQGCNLSVHQGSCNL